MNYEIHSIHRLAKNFQKLRNAILQILPLETSNFHIFREKKNDEETDESEAQLFLIKTPQSSPLIFTFFFFSELRIKERPNCTVVFETDEKSSGMFHRGNFERLRNECYV